ncbi:MAG TPA: sensor domain-containing diguanylate cyclase [bacterium]|nr:sensor domain-containing diguanylate cyclase [bacterium]
MGLIEADKALKPGPENLVSVSMRSFSRTASVVGIILGGVILVGWSYPFATLQHSLRYLELIRADTALALVLAGGSLWFLNRPGTDRVRNGVILVGAAGVILTGLLPLLEATGQVNLLNRLMLNLSTIFGEAARAERMALVTATYILLLGLSLFLTRSERWVGTGQVLAWLSVLVALTNFLGYSAGKSGNTFLSQTQPDLLITSAFVILGFGTLFVQPEKGVMSIVSRSGLAGTLTRRLLPVAIIVPFILRWVVTAGKGAGVISGEEALTLMAVSVIAVFCWLTWWNASNLSAVEKQRLKAEEELEKTNSRLTELVQQLENRSRQNAVLSEMRDLLQACSNVAETSPVIVASMEKLLPQAQGALFLFSPSRNDLESIARWGGFPEAVEYNLFTPDECWALRRGQIYVLEKEKEKDGLVCAHLRDLRVNGYVCLPLIAKGEVLGLFHLGCPAEVKHGCFMEMREIAVTIGEYLALAIANIKLRESLRMQSIRDILTGLYNRRYLEETMAREILRAARRHSTLGVVMIDIDHFKQFNDLYGHGAGDELLAQLGHFFRTHIRGSDIACRYGGEEFTLVMPDASLRDVVRRAEELRVAVKDLRVHYQGQLLGSITLSLGIAVYPEHGTTADELIRLADAALYRAKKEGRDRVLVA